MQKYAAYVNKWLRFQHRFYVFSAHWFIMTWDKYFNQLSFCIQGKDFRSHFVKNHKTRLFLTKYNWKFLGARQRSLKYQWIVILLSVLKKQGNLSPRGWTNCWKKSNNLKFAEFSKLIIYLRIQMTTINTRLIKISDAICKPYFQIQCSADYQPMRKQLR